MIVALRPPPGWMVRARGGRQVATSPSGLCAVEWSDLTAGVDSEREWMIGALRACAPGGCTFVIGAPAQRETVDGWPAILVDARFQRGDGSTAGVARGAFYRFLAFRGHAVALALEARDLDAAAIDDVLLGARPDLSGLYLGLCDFYGPEDVIPPTAPSDPTG